MWEFYLDRIQNEHTRRNLDVVNMPDKWENKLRWFGYIGKINNNDKVKKINDSEIIVEGNQGKGRPMKKWIGIIGENMRAWQDK